MSYRLNHSPHPALEITTAQAFGVHSDHSQTLSDRCLVPLNNRELIIQPRLGLNMKCICLVSQVPSSAGLCHHIWRDIVFSLNHIGYSVSIAENWLSSLVGGTDWPNVH